VVLASGKKGWGGTRAGWPVAGSSALYCWRENGVEIGSLSSFFRFLNELNDLFTSARLMWLSF